MNILLAGMLVATGLTSVHAVAASKLDDATIFSIFDQANMADITTARLGVKHAHSKQVRELAKSVASDHEAVQQMGRDLAKKLGIVPVPPDNDTSVENTAKALALLRSKSGVEFDKAYLKHELVFHQAVIDAIKGTLLPAIKDEQFKALINTVLPGFEHHLGATRAAAEKLGIAL